MNKQSSKESLRDKVKGIFGLGTPRPPSKQSDSKSSEFIITSDIIKVCRAKKNNPYKANKKCFITHTNKPPFCCMMLYVLVLVWLQELHPDCGLNSRVRVLNQVCELAKTKKFEEVRADEVMCLMQWHM